MKKTILFIIKLIILPLAIAMTGCGGGMDQGTSEVTIIINDNHTASFDIRKPAVFALVKHRLKKIMAVNEASAVPPGVSYISYTVSGANMSAITGTQSVSGSTITIVLYIPNGPNRHFVLDAIDISSNVLYRGETYLDLKGSATKLGMTMNAVLFAKNYGGTGADYSRYIYQTSDGGYIISGRTESFGVSSGDIWVVKLNSNGTVAWEKAYGGAAMDETWSIQQTSDGGYIVAGYTASFGAGAGDFWILKLNAVGAITWQKTYGGVNTDTATFIKQTSDGGYIVAGYTGPSGAYDFWVLKLNSNGTVAWQKAYVGLYNDVALSIQQTTDGGYIVAGYTNSFGALTIDIWILKLNSSGTVTWQKTYGSTGVDRVTIGSIQQTSDGGYIVVGWTNSFGAGGYDMWILKLNSSGTVTWQKTYGSTGDEYAQSVQQTSDGGYIVAGWTNSFGAGGSDIWVLKLNSNGAVAWEKAYGSTGTDDALSIQQASDGGYIVTGRAGVSATLDALLLRLSQDGTIYFNSTSGMTTTNTSATVTDTSATVSDTTVTDANTAVTPADSSATVTDTNATVTILAP